MNFCAKNKTYFVIGAFHFSFFSFSLVLFGKQTHTKKNKNNR